MASQARMPGVQTLPGELSGLFGIADPFSMSREEYTGLALGAVCAAAADHGMLGDGMFVDYEALPWAIAGRILPHFGMAPGPDDLAAMARVLSRDSKMPSLPFVPATRGSAASAEMNRCVAAYLAPQVARLAE